MNGCRTFSKYKQEVMEFGSAVFVLNAAICHVARQGLAKHKTARAAGEQSEPAGSHAGSQATKESGSSTRRRGARRSRSFFSPVQRMAAGATLSFALKSADF